MTASAATRRNAILERALSVDRTDLAEFLNQACAGDVMLRGELERLLHVHARMGTWSLGSFSGSSGPTLEPGRWLGRYELQGVLGSGGMGVVYRAYDPVIGRRVAIKVLAPRNDRGQHSSSRFLSELRMLGSVAHDNVVRVYDYGDVDDLRYIVMELLEGEDLGRAIATGCCGDLTRKLGVMRQIAAALDHIHGAGIVHCDLKPNNVFLESGGRAKLMDFGIAQARDSAGAACREIVGTPQYMAPEQLKGLPGGPLMDVYAFGIVLFEVLCGHRPFSGDSPRELLAKIAAQPVPKEPMIRADIPADLIELICRATASDPAARPQSFSDILQVLERTDARANSARTSPVRRSIRRRLLVAASGASIALFSSSGVQPAAKGTAVADEIAEPGRVPRSVTIVEASSVFAPAAAPALAAPALHKTDRERRRSLPPSESGAPQAPARAAVRDFRGDGFSAAAASGRLGDSAATPPPGAAPDGQSRHTEPGLGALHLGMSHSDATMPADIPDAAASLEWDRLRNSEDPEALRAFAAAYPQSPHRDSASRMTRELDARKEARREILALLDRYAAANRARDIREIATLWPGLAGERLRTIEASFAHVEKFDFTLRADREPELSEPAAQSAYNLPSYRGDAVVVCRRRVQMIDRSGVRPDPSESRVVVRLSRVDSKWTIMSID
jgi:serine/threonine protein kinase